MKSCLIVDDSATIRMAIARAVHAARGGGVEVMEAEDPSRAMKLFRDARPDVVFLDMVFPDEVDSTSPDRTDDKPEAGLALLRDMLRERPGVPILLVTGLPGNHPDVVDAVNLGAAGWMRKPIRPDDVRVALESLDPQGSGMDYIM